MLRLQVLHPALPLHRHHLRRRPPEGRDQRGAVQGLRHLRRLLPVRFDRPARGLFESTAKSSAKSKGCSPMTRPAPATGRPASWRSSATGAPTPRPTSPGCRASSTRQRPRHPPDVLGPGRPAVHPRRARPRRRRRPHRRLSPGRLPLRRGQLQDAPPVPAPPAMLQDLGIEAQRVRLEWISAAEGERSRPSSTR
jgi:hypothetical protein